VISENMFFIEKIKNDPLNSILEEFKSLRATIQLALNYNFGIIND